MQKKIRVAIWGLGRAGWGMHTNELDRYKDMFEVAGAFDILPERMDKLCARYPEASQYASADEMIADPNIDMISVAIRSPDHVAAVCRVLEAGKYAFSEKPVGINYSEIKQLMAVAAKHPGKLFCRHNRRFEAAFQHVSEIIKSGILGKVYEIKLCRHSYQRRNDWQTLKSCGGGQLNNWGPHLIDQALQFIGGPVASVWGDLKVVAATGDAEDHFKAVIRGENGLVVDVEVSGGVAIPSPIYAVYGTQGTLVACNEQEFQLKYLDMAKCSPAQPATGDTPPMEGNFGSGDGLVWIEEKVKCSPESGETLENIYSHIYRNIRENVPFPVKCEEAFEVVRISEMVRNSALSGK